MPTKHWLATAMLVLLVGCGKSEEERQQRKVELPEVFNGPQLRAGDDGPHHPH